MYWNYGLLVAERAVFCWRLIEKFVGEISVVYLGMSNRFNVWNINALCLRVSLFYNITSCNTVFYFNVNTEIKNGVVNKNHFYHFVQLKP